MAGHSRQFTPGGLPDNCETHCVSGNRTHDLPIVSPTRYQLCHRDHQVVDFRTNRKRVWDFLLVLILNSNRSAISSRFRDIRASVRRKQFSVRHPYSSQTFEVFPLARSVMLGFAESEYPRVSNRKIILEEFQPM